MALRPQQGIGLAHTLQVEYLPPNGFRSVTWKELRFSAADGEWRVAFVFDTKREAILLVAGDKSGSSEKRFYPRLVRRADKHFEAHPARLKKKGKKAWL